MYKYCILDTTCTKLSVTLVLPQKCGRTILRRGERGLLHRRLLRVSRKRRDDRDVGLRHWSFSSWSQFHKKNSGHFSLEN
jgi:hypothetical protein